MSPVNVLCQPDYTQPLHQGKQAITQAIGGLGTLGFVYRFAAVDGFGKPGKSAAAAAITLTTQGEMCI